MAGQRSSLRQILSRSRVQPFDGECGCTPACILLDTVGGLCIRVRKELSVRPAPVQGEVEVVDDPEAHELTET